MGSKKKLAQKLEKAKHANSRRTLAVIRDIKKIKKRDKIKGDFAAKVSSCDDFNLGFVVLQYLLYLKSI